MTSPDTLPNFLIVGAAKCGTTSLYRYLSEHPQVFMSPLKEPTYFVEPRFRSVATWTEYCALFAGATGYRARGEASVPYLYDPVAPGAIRQALGTKVRIIAILRNPVDMAYSQWAHMRRIEREPLQLLDAVHEEAHRAADPAFAERAGTWPANLLYVRRARYAPQLARHLEMFGRTNVLVLIFEEFFAEPRRGLERIAHHLGVDPWLPHKIGRHNPASVARSKKARRLLNERLMVKDLLKPLVPVNFRIRLKQQLNQLNSREQEKVQLSRSTRAELSALFRDDVRELERLLGRDLRQLWAI